MESTLIESATPIEQPAATDVRIRAAAVDAYAGLRGHEYIAARNLNKPAQRVQTSALKCDASEVK